MDASNFDLTALSGLWDLAQNDPIKASVLALVLVAGLAVRAYKTRKARTRRDNIDTIITKVLVVSLIVSTAGACASFTPRQRQIARVAGKTVCDMVNLACLLKGGNACFLVDGACAEMDRVQLSTATDENGRVRLIYCEVFEADEIEITPPSATDPPDMHTFASVDYLDGGLVRICDDLPFDDAEIEAVNATSGAH